MPTRGGTDILKAQIIGNIGSDPEMRYSAAGAPFLRFNVASNGRTRDTSGEWQETTEWVRVTVFGQRAEALSEHLTRGSRVHVDGRLETRPWVDRSNNPKAGLELMAESVEFASSRPAVPDERRTPVAAGAGYATGSTDVDLENVPF